MPDDPKKPYMTTTAGGETRVDAEVLLAKPEVQLAMKTLWDAMERNSEYVQQMPAWVKGLPRNQR